MSSPPDIEKTIGFALHHSSYLFKSALKNIFSAYHFDVTPEELILLFLVKDGGNEQSELVKKSLKDKTNITRLLSRMENKGFIKRTGHADNGRQQMVSITEAGVALRQKALPLIQNMVTRATEGINVAELEITQNTLNHISRNIKKNTL